MDEKLFYAYIWIQYNLFDAISIHQILQKFFII